MSTIFEVLGHGPIVAKDEDLGLLVTINGAYLNLWEGRTRHGFNQHGAPMESASWENTDCRCGHPDLYTLTVAKAMELAEEWLEEIRKGEDEKVG